MVEARLLNVEHIENLYMTTGSQFNAGGDTMARGLMEVVDTQYRCFRKSGIHESSRSHF